MNHGERVNNCQLKCMPGAFVQDTPFVLFKWVIHKIIWAIIRRVKIICSVLTRKLQHNQIIQNKDIFNQGEMVRIRSKTEITATLNAWNECKGCVFIEDMWKYCGTTQKVFKRVENFIDERNYRLRHVIGLYILENVFCQGTRILGRCDRSCFFFWRSEWFEKI